ncbi:MAG TPA: hypothetical protein VEI95_11225 [Acidobacteriota bacterium]|nr:hypothetical protein [Acidobacteriota bacterium]
MKSIMKSSVFGMVLLLLLGLMPAQSHSAQDPWEFLDGFTPLPQSLTRIAEHYVAIIFINRDEQLVAAVFFNASCVPASCELHHRAGYAVANEAGSNARFYVEPDEKELIAVIGAIAAKYNGVFQSTNGYATEEAYL